MLPGLIELYILLFADDLTLMSYTAIGLTNHLKCLNVCCSKLQLSVNVDKTKVMVFRKGGFLSMNEKWYFEGKQLEVVNSYRYLGYTFTTKMSVSVGTNIQAVKETVKGKEAAYSLSSDNAKTA